MASGMLWEVMLDFLLYFLIGIVSGGIDSSRIPDLIMALGTFAFGSPAVFWSLAWLW